MRSFFVLATILLSGTAHAWGGRSLPSGEENPAVVEAVYASPRGEVHFVAVAGGHSALLRNNKGGLASLKEVGGPSSCDEWFTSSKTEAIPRGCDFVFHDETDGQLYSVRSEEMEEGSLFQAVRGTTRGVLVAL